MTTNESSGAGPDGRVILAVVLLLLLLLAASCAGYTIGRSEDDAAAPPVTSSPTPSPASTSPTPSAPSPTSSPAPSVTVTVSAPAQSGGSGAGGPDAGSGGGSSGSGQGSVDGGSAMPFSLSAALGDGPVLIGEQRTLRVQVHNPNPHPLSLLTVRATPGTPSRAGCLASWVDVTSYDASSDPQVTVPAGGDAVLSLVFQLRDLPTTNQNACQGASFSLMLHGTGRLG